MCTLEHECRVSFLFELYDDHRDLHVLTHSFPTRRSSDLAEKQILRALSKMSRSTQTDKLTSAFETHREETEKQIERLEQVFEMCGKRPQGKQCEAIPGHIEESKETMDDIKGSQVLDAGPIGAAQEIGRESGGERVCKYGQISGGAGSKKEKK